METLQPEVYSEPPLQPEGHQEAPSEEVAVFEPATESAHNEHYSDQSGHRERGLMNRAMHLANRSVDESADVVSRGQLYLDRRHYVPRYPRDGRR